MNLKPRSCEHSRLQTVAIDIAAVFFFLPWPVSQRAVHHTAVVWIRDGTKHLKDATATSNDSAHPLAGAHFHTRRLESCSEAVICNGDGTPAPTDAQTPSESGFSSQ